MKKIICLFLILAFSLGEIALGAPARPVAAVKDVVGIVKVKRAEAKLATTVTPGNLIYDGDALTTGNKATIALLFTDGSMLKVQENSDVTIKAIRRADQQLDASVNMPIGELWAKVTRRDSKFEVETPSSVASVKGTEFSLLVDESGTSTLFVLEGLVQFQNEMGSVMVKRNQKSLAMKNVAPESPQKMSKKEQEKKIEEAPKWDLEMKAPSGKQTPNQSFQMQIRSINTETNKVDLACNTNVSISSATPGSQFSLDQATWNTELDAKLSSGVLNFYARCRSAKDMVVSASGENCRSTQTTVQVGQSQQQAQKNKESIKGVVNKLGDPELDGLNISDIQITSGGGEPEQVIEKINSGEMEIISKEIIEQPDGSTKVIIRVKPK